MGRTRRGQHGPWQRAARRRARSCSSKAPRAAAAVHVVHGTWCRGCLGRASGGPAAEDIGAPPKYKGCLSACTARSCSSAGGEGKRLCRVRDAAAASGGPAAEDIGARPKHKGRLARAIGSVASRAYLLRRQQGWQSDQKWTSKFASCHSICPHSIRTEDLGELKVERRFRYIIFDSSQVTSSHNRSLARSAIWRATRGVFPLDMIPLCPPGPRAKARPAPQAHILLVLRDRIRSNRPTGRRRF